MLESADSFYMFIAYVGVFPVRMDFLYPLRIVLLVEYLPFPDAFWALSLAPLSQTREKVLSNFSSFETESALVPYF